MTDLAVRAIGFGVIPPGASLLYSFRGFVLRRNETVWGFLAGVIAFLTLAHAMAAVLVNKPLFGDAPLAIAVAVVGLVVGAGIAWLLMEGPLIRTEGSRILWLAVAFVGLHSFGDGLVLGQAFVGIVAPNIPVAGLNVSATFVAAIEATLGLLLLVRGFLPIAMADRGNRWPLWTVVGFIAIALVHFFVE